MALAVISIGLWFVPQLNLLNYYFALAIAFVAPIGAGVVGVRVASDLRDAPYGQVVLVGLGAGVGLLLGPLLLVSAAALRVPNCDWLGGLGHYLMGPGLGCVYGASFGVALGTALERRWATLAVPIAWVTVAAMGLLHFYLHPPIFAYNPFVGFFNGAVYDDIIEIGRTYLLYRTYTVLQAGMWLAFGWLARSFRRGQPVRGLPLGLAFALVVAQGPLVLMKGSIGWEVTGDDIAETLGGRLETEHFVIFYPEGSPVAQRIERLGREHEFRYHQLKTVLGVAPDRKIRSYMYSGTAQKKALMGAGATYIAKPWSGEVHLNALDVGAPVLKHELAHVFGAEIAGGWLGIPTDFGLMPKMAIVEGFAVALTEVRGRLTLHQWSAAMLELGIAPPIARILSSVQFLGTHSGQAYTLAGSFLAYLLETRGTARLKTLYATGSLSEAYPDEGAATVIAAWEGFLKDRTLVPLSEEDLRLARFRYDVPSKFHRVCTLEIAGWERDAQAARAAGDNAEALRLYEKVAAYDAGNPGKRWQVLNALINDGKLDLALDAATGLLEDPAASKILRSRVRGRRADVMWLQGRDSEAAQAYLTLLGEPLDEGTRRRVAVCTSAVAWKDRRLSQGVRDYLLGDDLGTKKAISRLTELGEGELKSGIIPYLTARRLQSAERFEEAEAAYTRAITIGLKSIMLRREALKQRGISRFHRGRYKAAVTDFRAALPLVESRGFKAVLDDWIERARWNAGR